MSVLSAAEKDGMDVVTVEITVPRPRAAAPSSVAAGRAAPAAARSYPRAPRPAAAAGRAAGDRELHVRRVRVSEVRVRELRAGDEVRAREARARELRSVTVQAREMRGRGLADGRLRVDGWLRVDGRLRGGGEMRGGGLADARLRGEVRRRNSRAPSSGTPAAGYASGLRLTRRGRVVLTGFAIVLAAALVTLFWLSAAEGAQAASHGQRPVAARRGLSRVVVRPGQTLWSIARRAEPSADPRIVVQQIIEVNALSGAMIQPGELLWVPKG